MAKAKHNHIAAREGALVDGQCLIQRALNNRFGNPRKYEDTDPRKTQRLFKEQRRKLAKKLGWSSRKVNRLFADDSKLKVKDLAEVLHVLGYRLQLFLGKDSHYG